MENYSSEFPGTNSYNDYLNKLKKNSRAAVSAFSAFEHSENKEAQSLCLQKFLNECENISKLLWSSDKKSDKYIKSVLAISNGSPLSQKNISGFKTILKSIEKRKQKREEIDKTKGLEKESQLQNHADFSYDLRTKVLIFNGKEYEIWLLFLAVGELYASLPFFEELRKCTEMLQKNFQDPTALFQKAVLLYKARRFEPALAFIEKALEIVPDDYRVWYNKGVILSETGRLEEAVSAYNRAIELEPAFEIAWDNKGVTLARLGRFEEAIKNYEEILLKHPNYAEAWAGKGSILSSLDRKEEAIEAYNSALKIRPDYLEALTCIANLFSRLGRFEQAVETYNKALLLTQAEPGLWAGRGLVFLEMGKFEDALENCNRALKLKPNFLPALEIKVKILSEISRQKEKVSR